MHLFNEYISIGSAFFLLLALALALSFECVNGFHDTANAVATVIYTHSLKPIYAVIYSGIWNLIGVLTSSGLVAYGIIALLPHDLVMNIGTGTAASEYIGFAMIFSLLLSAIIWNVGTWYFGLPVSSTHTLIGAILGVGVAHAVLSGQHWTKGLNWEQIDKVILALALSPLVGFVVSGLVLLMLKLTVHREDLFKAPGEGEVPPPWIRGTLISTCTGVSFAHGYNDGQKGMGLIMLILIGVLPGAFALQSPKNPAAFQTTSDLAQQVSGIFQSMSAPGGTPAPPAPDQAATPAPDTSVENNPATSPVPAEAQALKPPLENGDQKVINDYIKSGKSTPELAAAFSAQCLKVKTDLSNLQSFESLPDRQREQVRKDIYLLNDGLVKAEKAKLVKDGGQAATIKKLQGSLLSYIQYIPVWVKVAVALALGLGTMVGWRRVVVTVGEKIGKAHLTYAQGASAEMVAFITVLGAGLQGWPVSTTHVLSSGIAGTMAANRSGLQTQTLINIVLAWVLTLPICVFLGASLFSAALYLIFHLLGVH